MSLRRDGTVDSPSTEARLFRSAVDVLLGGALVYMLFLIVSAALDSANRRTELRLLTSEAQALYEAFERYTERNHGYPASYSGAVLDPRTLDPLRKRGYYRGGILAVLRDGRIDAYDSPDDGGPNREFWVEMSLRSDPSVRVLVARSDDAPLAGGTWRDGVFVYRDGELRAP